MAPDGSGAEIALVALGAAGADSGEEALWGHRVAPHGGSGHGVLVVGEGAQIDEAVRNACARLARAGFLALAAPHAAGPRGLARGVRTLQSDAALAGRRVVALGFGAGGVAALSLAASDPRVAAVVSMEGVPAAAATVGTLPPALLVFGGEDAEVSAAAKSLAARQPAVRLHAEAGASEGFTDERRADRHAALAAARAWDAALAFLRAAT